MSEPIHILSLGAGVQSSTLALMAAAGEVKPMPSAGVFADTQAEPKEVYDWLEWLECRLPFPVVRIVYKPEKTVIEKVFEWGFCQLPCFTKDGLGKRQCTKHWKVTRVAKAGFEVSRRKPFVQWVGISRDEAHRMKPSKYKKITTRWPLIELGMNRNDCLKWMERHGYPKPPRSACVFCPFQNNDQWKRTWNHQLTIEVEKICLGRGEFLHNSKQALIDVDFNKPEKQLNLFGNECEGMCGV